MKNSNNYYQTKSDKKNLFSQDYGKGGEKNRLLGDLQGDNSYQINDEISQC